MEKFAKTFSSPVYTHQLWAFGKRYTEDLEFVKSEVRLRTQFGQFLINYEKISQIGYAELSFRVIRWP